MKLRLFVCVYGREFLSLFQQVACRSLLQPRNKAALAASDVTVALYSDPATMEEAAETADHLGTVERHWIEPTANAPQTQQAAIMAEIRRCIDEDATCIMVCPDNFWGDGTLPNLLAIAGEAQGICLAVPHPRVNRLSFECRLMGDSLIAGGKTLDNGNLVYRAMQVLHPSWTNARETPFPADTSSFNAGISWSGIGDGLYAVSHLLPTVFVARFIEADYILFREAIAKGLAGIWDHHWPIMLVNTGRQRVIGSSDAAFIVELTDADSHNVPLTPNDPKEPNRYHRDAPHIRANRNVTAIWRAA